MFWNRYPGYNFLTIILAAINMFHWGIVLASLVTGLLSGILWAAGQIAWSLVFVVVAVLGLTQQVVSRVVHIHKIRCLRIKNGTYQVKNPHSGKWVGFDQVVSFEKAEFRYADPWRPFTLGYPGIRFALKPDEGPTGGPLILAEDMFGYGMEPMRDRVFETLHKKYPAHAVDV